MDNSFFAYMQKLELLAFFSGYPLLYTVIFFIAGKRQLKNNFKSMLVSCLPFAYALVGSLYLGLQLRNLYPDYSIQHIKLTTQQPLLMAWGLLSILFWLPAVAKKTVLSLLHSLVFFFFLARDIFLQLPPSADKDMLRNDMKIYTDSLLLNLGAVVFLALLSFLYARYKKRLKAIN